MVLLLQHIENTYQRPYLLQHERRDSQKTSHQSSTVLLFHRPDVPVCSLEMNMTCKEPYISIYGKLSCRNRTINQVLWVSNSVDSVLYHSYINRPTCCNQPQLALCWYLYETEKKQHDMSEGPILNCLSLIIHKMCSYMWCKIRDLNIFSRT